MKVPLYNVVLLYGTVPLTVGVTIPLIVAVVEEVVVRLVVVFSFERSVMNHLSAPGEGPMGKAN